MCKKYPFVNSMFFILISLCLFATIVGCATPLPKFDIPQTARIGIINLLEQEVTHTHIGTTVFTNFTDKYAVDWNLPGTIESKLKEKILENSNFEVIHVEATPLIEEKKEKVIVNPWDKFYLNPDLVADFEKIAKEKNLDLIFVIRSYSSEDYKGVSGLYIGGYGFYTRTLLMIKAMSYPYAKIRIDAIWTNPPTYTGAAFYKMPSDKMPEDMKVPVTGSLHNIPMEEIDKLRPMMTADIESMVHRVLISANIIK